jgi:hypothetical protein
MTRTGEFHNEPHPALSLCQWISQCYCSKIIVHLYCMICMSVNDGSINWLIDWSIDRSIDWLISSVIAQVLTLVMLMLNINNCRLASSSFIICYTTHSSLLRIVLTPPCISSCIIRYRRFQRGIARRISLGIPNSYVWFAMLYEQNGSNRSER